MAIGDIVYTGDADPEISISDGPANRVTTTSYDGVLFSIRTDFDFAELSGAVYQTSFYAGFYDVFNVLTVRQIGSDAVNLDGTTRSERVSGGGFGSTVTVTVVDGDPSNVQPWTEIETVTRTVEGFQGIGDVTSTVTYDDGRIVSSFSSDIQGLISRQTIDPEAGLTINEEYNFLGLSKRTTEDTSDTHDYQSIVETFDFDSLSGRVQTNNDGSVLTTQYIFGLPSVETYDADGQPGGVGLVRTFAPFSTDIVSEVETRADGIVVTTAFSAGKATSVTSVDAEDAAAWSTHTVTFNAAGQRTLASTVNDDHSTAVTNYVDGVRSSTTIDLDGDDGNLGSVRTFDAEGVLSQIVKTTANGAVTTDDYADGALVGRAIADDGDVFAWTSHAVTFDAGGQRTSTRTVNDDGTISAMEFTDGVRSRQTIDRVEGQGGIDSVRTFDASGALSSTQWTTSQGVMRTNAITDGAVTSQLSLDAADQFDFYRHENVLEDGTLTRSITEYDSGLIRTLDFDEGVLTSRTFTDGGEAYDWQSRDYAYDDQGNVTGIHTVWDDASVTDTGSFL